MYFGHPLSPNSNSSHSPSLQTQIHILTLSLKNQPKQKKKKALINTKNKQQQKHGVCFVLDNYILSIQPSLGSVKENDFPCPASINCNSFLAVETYAHFPFLLMGYFLV